MFIPSTFKRPVSSWKALNLRKTLLMASSVRLKPLNCSRLPCVYAQETLDRKSGSAGMPRPISYAVFCLKKKKKIKNIIYVSVEKIHNIQKIVLKRSYVNIIECE